MATAKVVTHGRNVMQWAIGGWTLFITENVILSENRTWLINKLGDDGYHVAYGICSTAACATIGYGYMYKLKPVAIYVPSPQAKIASFIFTSLGLVMLSQIPPKLQVPITYAGEFKLGNENSANNNYPTLPKKEPPKWKVQCPFDFTESKSRLVGDDVEIKGLDRISRHPGLWSFAFVGLGNACLASTLALRAWWSMPTLVAAIGGWHTDSRFQRGMGGTPLPPQVKEQTSNLPFYALLTNDNTMDNLTKFFANECKPLNLGIAVTLASILVFKRKP